MSRNEFELPMKHPMTFFFGMAEKEAKGGTIFVRVCKREGCGQELDR